MSSKHCCTSSSVMSPSRALVIAGKDPLETSMADAACNFEHTANTPLTLDTAMLVGMR